jgi:hypothetical protein|tara:strand:- start:984 stop:1640 length:657 start_codon:yes stop_codon:yes gene_type:complete
MQKLNEILTILLINRKKILQRSLQILYVPVAIISFCSILYFDNDTTVTHFAFRMTLLLILTGSLFSDKICKYLFEDVVIFNLELYESIKKKRVDLLNEIYNLEYIKENCRSLSNYSFELLEKERVNIINECRSRKAELKKREQEYMEIVNREHESQARRSKLESEYSSFYNNIISKENELKNKYKLKKHKLEIKLDKLRSELIHLQDLKIKTITKCKN